MLAGISNSGATIIAAVIGVFGLIFVAVVTAAWKSISNKIGASHDDLKGDLKSTNTTVTVQGAALINHGERIAYLEGLRQLPRGSLGRTGPSTPYGDVGTDPGSG